MKYITTVVPLSPELTHHSRLELCLPETNFPPPCPQPLAIPDLLSVSLNLPARGTHGICASEVGSKEGRASLRSEPRKDTPRGRNNRAQGAGCTNVIPTE